MRELKGETPQEGINRGRRGDRAKHGDQMAGRRPRLVRSRVSPPWRRGAEDGTASDP